MPLPNNFTLKAQEAIQRSQEIASENGQPAIEPIHLLSSLLSQDEGLIPAVLQKLGTDSQNLIKKTEEVLVQLPKQFGAGGGIGQIFLSPATVRAFQTAAKIAKRFGDSYLSTEHLFFSLMQDRDVGRLLKSSAVTEENFLSVLKEIRGAQKIETQEPEATFRVLEKYTRNLTEEARRKKLDPVIGRDSEIRRVLHVLSRRRKNNPVLIGEAGVGKTAIMEGLAQRITSGDVPESLKDKEVVALDIGAMVAGTKFRGEFEDRLKALLKEIESAHGKYVLFIDELHTLVGAGTSEGGTLDASNMLKPALARGELRAIGATTLKEYQKHIEKDPALERRFQPVFVDEPTIEDTIAILRGIKEIYELHHGVRVTDPAIVAAVELSVRYITDRQLPDKAIDLIDEAAAALRLQIDSMPEELDILKRSLMRHEVEREALRKEEDAESKERLIRVEKEIADLREKMSGLETRWSTEKGKIARISSLKKERDTLRAQSEMEERKGDLQRVAEIRYRDIPRIEEEIKQAEAELASLRQSGSMLKEVVMEEDIAAVVSRWSGVPASRLLETEQSKLMRMEEELAERVVGQKQATTAVSNALRRSRAGISEEHRPIGSFIFLGPTGVGKTELARSLAEFMFNREDALVRVDMSEYMEKHTVSKILGSPPGYVGYEEGGQLTEKIRRRPYSVVLFDEIEKAHPDVFNLLLQILDDGQITDAKGRRVNFKNTIIVMTSNIGSDLILNATKQSGAIGFDGDRTAGSGAERQELENRVRALLQEHFRPEFLNRVDEIIMFDSLSPENIADIVELQLSRVAQRLKEQKKIVLTISKKAKKILAEKGYDPAYGARPLKRLIQKEILDELAKQIIAGKIIEGKTVVIDGSKDGRLILSS